MKLTEKMTAGLLLSVAFSFMMAIFAPLDAYLANADEFWFGLKDIIPIVLGAFLGGSGILALLLYVIKDSKFFFGIYSFLLSAYVYFYLQGNYVPRNYGVLDGRPIDYGAYENYGTISIVLILLSFVLWAFLMTKLKERVYVIGQYICIFLLLIQVSTISVLVIKNVILNPDDKNPLVVTDKGVLDLSENRNIIVFILDTFDSKDMEDMLAGPHADWTKAIFKDFTYYPDTVGAYPTTSGSLPFILTGQWYENEKTYRQYVREAYQKTKRYQVLRENDFSVGLYTLPMFISLNTEKIVNVEEGYYTVKNHWGFLLKLCRLVAFDYFPHQIKRYFYIATDEFDNHMKIHSGGTVGEDGVSSYDMGTQEFYESFMKKTLTISSQNAFRVYHLMGVHPPYTFGKDLLSQENSKYTVLDEAAGCFTLLEAYLNRLKENGIYDNATIIIMSDHGNYHLSYRPLFMIKNANQNQEFCVSNKRMSWEYLDDMIIALGKNLKVDDSFVADNYKKHNEQRRYLFYTFNDFWEKKYLNEFWDKKYLPRMREILFSGAVNDNSAIKVTGCIFQPRGIGTSKDYVLGEEILFEKERNTAKPYCILGFSGSEKSGTWTNWHEATMLFELADCDKDVFLEMHYQSYGRQKVELYANDQPIADFVANGDEKQSIRIPHEYISDGRLVLRFALPDAISPKAKGESDDGRDLALFMKSMKLSSADAEKR